MTNSFPKSNSDNSDTVANSGTRSSQSTIGGLTARDRVMLEFQRTTLQMTLNMMHAQQEVLLAYLNGTRNGNGHSASVDSVAQAIQNSLQSQQLMYAQQAPVEPPAPAQYQQFQQAYVEQAPAPRVEVKSQHAEVRAEAAPVTSTVQPVAPSTTPADAIDVEHLVSSLVDIVSERTGYPPDMLDPELDLEADLGIDSIKRVEILNSFRRLLPEAKQQALEESIEQLAGLKTLQGIMNWIRTDLPTIGNGPVAATSAAATAVDRAVVAKGARLHAAQVSQPEPGVAHFAVTLNTKTDLYLNDHTFDGVPVMPMAMATELMLEAATACHGGCSVVSIRNMEIPAGIVFESGTKDLLITAHTESVTASRIIVKTSVMTVGALKRTHFKAVVELTPGPVPALAPVAHLPAVYTAPSYEEPATPPTLEQIYGEIMFHGKLFQGIKSVTAVGRDGITGEIFPTPINELLSLPITEDWILDPILLDSAMQMAGVWGRHHLQITLLPNGFDAIRWIRPMKAKAFRVSVSTPSEVSGLELRCDLTVYSETGELVLVMEGLKGIGSKSLNRLAAKKVQQGTGS